LRNLNTPSIEHETIFISNRVDGATNQRNMRQLLVITLILALAGCASPIPFSAVSLGGEPTVTSTKQAALSHVSGPALDRLGSVSLAFAEKDQAEFIDVLRTELLRLKVFKAVRVGGESAEGADFRITVIFTKTIHDPHKVLRFPGWPQDYELHVVMTIAGGKAPWEKAYQVNAQDGLSYWTSINTNAYEAKVIAVRKLLEKLVPDIQAYVAGTS
jgi:hypothetical protein